jgi:hypothetical protein
MEYLVQLVCSLLALERLRDLASLSARRLLLLSGPVQNQDIDFRVHKVDLNTSVPHVMLGVLEKLSNGKTEVIAVIRESLDTADF